MQVSLKPKFDLIGYVLAWFTYGGKALTKIGNLGNVIRDSFSDLVLPRKEDYVK